MLEIQSVILGKLAAEENHLKGFAEVPGLAVSNIDERVKEVGEALTMLKY
jgi:ABC-type Na+ transport system ATPase subunit NatA